MEALTSGYGLIEGPVYDAERGLIFSDVINGGVFCLSESTAQVETLIPHRRGIGGMVPHMSGGMVVSGRNIAVKIPGQEGTHVLLEAVDAAEGVVGFNDITTDATGRIYAGSLCFSPVFPGSEQKPGHLHVIDLDGSTRLLASGIELTNGLGVSPDGGHLYHSDSLSHVVWVYEVHDDGSVGGKQPFAEIKDGHADGLALTEDGTVWVAVAGGGCVRVFHPDGSEMPRLEVPQPMVTSLCFGGKDLQDLYVVTGSRDSGRDDAGTVYRTRVDVPGLPVHPARVPLP